MQLPSNHHYIFCRINFFQVPNISKCSMNVFMLLNKTFTNPSYKSVVLMKELKIDFWCLSEI